MSRPMKRNCEARLEIGLGDFRQRVRHRRRLGNVAVADLAVRLLVHDHTWLGRELVGRHVPGRSRIGDQDFPRLRAGQPQFLVISGDREAADGRQLTVEDRVAIDLIVVRRFRNTDPAPIGVEVLGEDQRQRGAHALTHLHHRRDNGDDIVFADRDPGVGIERCRGGRSVKRRAEGDSDAEGAGGHQERTARERQRVGIVQHDALPL